MSNAVHIGEIHVELRKQTRSLSTHYLRVYGRLDIEATFQRGYRTIRPIDSNKIDTFLIKFDFQVIFNIKKMSKS